MSHIPFRQCLACRERKPKGELLRLVQSSQGPQIDLGSRQPGRGAYVCRQVECWSEKKLRRFAGAKAAELSGALYALVQSQPG
jgi:uncharacterized protein